MDSFIAYEDDDLKEKAQLLADAFHLTLNKDASTCVFVRADTLVLKAPGLSPMSADFSRLTWAKRKNEGKKQGLVRACKPTPLIKIIDATAGWGRDAAVLASFGAQVLMIERNRVMAALLDDALKQQSEQDQQELKLSLHHGDAFSYLSSLDTNEYPDVIYIDPMHPERQKSALVKKDMQVLQQMIGPDDDALALITLAMTRVKQRVVVKWPQKTPSLTPAHASIDGKTVRFDMYFNPLRSLNKKA